jgi:hypothetical protein
MRPLWPLLKGMERYHRSNHAAPQHEPVVPLLKQMFGLD